MDPDQLRALGLYDPGAPHAELRLELIDYLLGLGATTDDLVAYRDTLPALAAALAFRGGPPRSLTEGRAPARA